MQIKTLAVSVATALAALAMSAQAEIITKTVAGHNGPVTVQVNVQNGAVKSVKITKSSETPGIGTRNCMPASMRFRMIAGRRRSLPSWRWKVFSIRISSAWIWQVLLPRVRRGIICRKHW